MRSYTSLWPLGVAAIGLAGLVYAAMQWLREPPPPLDDELAYEAPTVDPGPDEHFEPVRRHLVDQFATYRGEVRAGSPIEVRAPQGMKIPIVRVHHESGDMVKKGDVLFSFHKPQIDKAIAQAKEKGDTASAETWARYYEYMELKAPCDGIVDQINRTLGEIPIDMNESGQGAPLATIQDENSFRFVVQVPGDVQRAAMALGTQFVVELDDDMGSVKGKVVEYLPAVASDVPVVLALEPHAGIQTLVKGSVRVASGQSEAGLVPRKAVIRRGDLAFVRAWDAESDSITEKSVELGDEAGEDVVVLKGVYDGDTVVVPGRKPKQ